MRDAVARDDGVADVGVGVLDDDVALGIAPGHVEGLHRAAAELAFDARPAEGAEQHAVELAGAVHLDGARRRAERRHQPGQEPIALLPVGAGDVKRHARRRPPPNVVVPLKVTNVSSVATSPDAMRDAVAVERVVERAAHAARARCGVWLLNGPDVSARASAAATCASASSRPIGDDPAPASRRSMPLPGRSRNAPSGHSSRLLPVARPASRMPRSSKKSVSLLEVDVLVLDVEARAPRSIRPAERRHQVLEARAAAEELGARARHLEAVRHPLERALEVLEAVVVEAGLAAEEIALELAAALEEVERAGEVAFAVQRERVAWRRRSRACAGTAPSTSPGRTSPASAPCRRRRSAPTRRRR